jgi:hypothetical protein
MTPEFRVREIVLPNLITFIVNGKVRGNICGNYFDDVKIEAGACTLMLPNAFTHNGDGINDIFGAKYPFAVREFIFSI